MTASDEQCIDLGVNMWLSLADTFGLAMQADGITDIPDQTLVFAGFINTMAGTMLATLGPDVVRAILDQAKDNCSRSVRSRFVVVPT
jgi:hypothetical protein